MSEADNAMPRFQTPLPDYGQIYIEPAMDEVQFCQPKLLPIVSNAVLQIESKSREKKQPGAE